MWEIKLLVDSANGDRTMSYNQINSFIKAVKDKRLTKMTKSTAVIMVAIATAV
jgi:hypothetical protein